ncbi:hypothetical protein D9C73_016787 [Collichthys lucidus]|uniref:Uncharacterized protein n=1 Tax=Collichthys lucidus TaxID=240159 RepID=A0A4U5V553_COLLU|nr:hypothetical protein D9C73_016787 [Collichthys lucidus]
MDRYITYLTSAGWKPCVQFMWDTYLTVTELSPKKTIVPVKKDGGQPQSAQSTDPFKTSHPPPPPTPPPPPPPPPPHPRFTVSDRRPVAMEPPGTVHRARSIMQIHIYQFMFLQQQQQQSPLCGFTVPKRAPTGQPERSRCVFLLTANIRRKELLMNVTSQIICTLKVSKHIHLSQLHPAVLEYLSVCLSAFYFTKLSPTTKTSSVSVLFTLFSSAIMSIEAAEPGYLLFLLFVHNACGKEIMKEVRITQETSDLQIFGLVIAGVADVRVVIVAVLGGGRSKSFVSAVFSPPVARLRERTPVTATGQVQQEDRLDEWIYFFGLWDAVMQREDQSLRADNRDQAFTSLTSVHQDLPTWLSHQEHPLILELASAFSRLAISTDQDPSEPQGNTEERAQPELQLPVTSDQAQSYRDGLKPAMKRQRDTSSLSGESTQPERKRKKMDVDSKESSFRAAEEMPQKKRKRAAFIEQQKKKRRMRRLFRHSRKAPSERPTDAPEMKPPRKRTWGSPHAHSGSG